MKIKAFHVLIPLLLLASFTCSLPFQGVQPTTNPVTESPADGSIGTVSREKSEVKHSTSDQAPVTVVSSDSLFTGDGVQVVDGGIGLLDFGDSLKLRLFNDSNMNVVAATQPGIPLVASLFLTVGGFTGELVESGGKVVFQTPNQAQISVTGTEFFLAYDIDKQMATAGKWVGSMQVTSAGETISINDGYYVDIPAGQPPGQQIQNPLGFQEFEAIATELNDPLAAVDRIRPVETPPPVNQPSVNLLGPVDRGQTVRGEISDSGSANEYSIEAASAEVFIVRIASDGSIQPGFQLLNQQGASLCEAGGGDLILGNFCAVAGPGSYSLRVLDVNSDETGAYSLFFQSLTDPVNSIPLSLYQPYDDRLVDRASVSTYEFGGSAGDLLLIRTADPFGEFKPGQWVYFNHQFLDCPGSRQGSLTDMICPIYEKGFYHLFVDDPEGTSAGAYQMYLSNLADQRHAPVLEAGQRYVDKIGYPTQVNAYTLFGKDGETREVRLLRDSGDLELEARLFRMDGQVICQGNTMEKELVVPCTLDGSGEYRLVIGDYTGAHTGSYVVWLVPPVDIGG